MDPAAQFESWQMAVFVFLGLNIIQFAIGSYLEPRFSGTALAVSPFLIVFTVFFWTFLWGIPGAFIGVPVTMAILTVCELGSSSRWIATLCRGRSATAPEARPADSILGEQAILSGVEK